MYKKAGEFGKVEEFFKMWFFLVKLKKEKSIYKREIVSVLKLSFGVYFSLSLYIYNIFIDIYGKVG